jgi:hypothetical protein
MHRDPTIRYHLVLKTNPQAFFIFPSGGVFSIPADNHIYRLDTRELHTAINGGEESRVHLVISEAED